MAFCSYLQCMQFVDWKLNTQHTTYNNNKIKLCEKCMIFNECFSFVRSKQNNQLRKSCTLFSYVGFCVHASVLLPFFSRMVKISFIRLNEVFLCKLLLYGWIFFSCHHAIIMATMEFHWNFRYRFSYQHVYNEWEPCKWHINLICERVKKKWNEKQKCACTHLSERAD